jgi:transposase
MLGTNPAVQQEPAWAAFAAIDWADQQHTWTLVPAGSSLPQRGQVENTPEALHLWATALSVQFDGRPIAVCLEQCRGSLIYALSKYAHFVLFPIHPTTAARYRQTFSPSGAKDDPRDADSLLDLLLHHRHQLPRWQPDTVTNRHLQRLVEQRRLMVHEKTRQSNRLTACLKTFFPQILDWFADDITAPMVADFLQRWPTLEQLQHSHPGTLKKFFLQHNSRSEKRIKARLDAIYLAIPLTHDEAVLQSESIAARGFLSLLKTLHENIAILDHEIQQLVAHHPDTPIFGSLPGAGPATIPRLIVAFGSRRERYASAYEMQCYSGIAPVKEASGRHEWTHFRRACPKFLRQTFHEYAFLSTRKSAWAQAYYRHQREKGVAHPAAVRSLAYKWIRIIFRCWKDSKPYDESLYTGSQQKRRSPLAALGIDTKEVAGFQKPVLKKSCPKRLTE